MNKRSKSKSKISKKALTNRFVGLGMLVALIIGLAGYLAVFHGKSSSTSTQVTGTTADGKKDNLSPPTPTEKNASDAAKNAIIQREQQSSGTSQNPTITVVITDASASGLKAYVTGVFEDGGTCLATASQGSNTVSGSSAGFKNVSYTQCAPISWSLGPGIWTVTVKYSSPSGNGSQTTTVKV